MLVVTITRRAAQRSGAGRTHVSTTPTQQRADNEIIPRLILLSVTKHHRNNANIVHSSKQIVSNDDSIVYLF